jgi:hypothetical protein
MAIGADILNAIRAQASTEYQDRIPEATRENFSQVGTAIMAYEPAYNEFLADLIHKIGKTMIESKLFKNKLANFKTGEILTKQDVEEIFVDMGKSADPYDPNGTTALARFDPSDTYVTYHRENRQDCYAISLGDIDFVKAFRSEATFDNFFLAQLNSIYSRAANDEWVHMKNLLATYDGYFDIMTTAFEHPSVTGVNEKEALKARAAKDFVKSVRKVKEDLCFASFKYNKSRVMTWCEPDDLVMFVHKDVVAEVDVELLASAFNISKVDIPTRIVVMDDFGSGSTETNPTYAILADKNFFRVWDTLSRTETQRNAQGLFTNYFYHVHQILSLSPFKNAVRICAPID